MAEESLSAEVITERLGTQIIGRKVLYFTSLTSTNDVARQEARQGAVEGTVIVADEQTSVGEDFDIDGVEELTRSLASAPEGSDQSALS